MKPTDIRICQVHSSLERIAYRTPMKFGGRVVTEVTLLNVEAIVETRDGKRGVGIGSMPMGNAWSWPSSAVTSAQTLEAMIELEERLTKLPFSEWGLAHALEHCQTLSEFLVAEAKAVEQTLSLAEPLPKLAQLVAASPLEAAIFDAQGKALGRSAYDLLDATSLNRDLSAYLSDDFRGEYLDLYTLRSPQAKLPLYHLVGALDPLTDADITTRVGDGLPETLSEWIRYNGLTHLKIKLAGDDLAWDVARVAAVEQVTAPVQTMRGCAAWHYSLDFNERCANVEYVLDFLAKLAEASPAALPRVQYIEQPTHRDLRAHPENRMHAAAKIKPVVIDESLVDFESLLLAREQGYSGVALKACKGQRETLLMGAAAQKFGLFLCVQDLTCVGASFLHSASLAARMPGIAAIEGNGRQYCPAGNRVWEDRYPGMFRITDGTLATGTLNGPGLGY